MTDQKDTTVSTEDALRSLVLCRDLYEVSDRTHMDAFYLLAHQNVVWTNARNALAAAATHPTPIEPVAVTEAMVERFGQSFWGEYWLGTSEDNAQVRAALTAALQVKP